MAQGGGAGSSAAEEARRLRDEAARLQEQVARLEERADNWDNGALGESLTGELLAPLSSAGFVVLHDLAVPGSKANVDHVAVTSWGVVVIDTKNYSRPVKLTSGMLWRGKYPMSRELDTLLWETDQVRAAVSQALPQWQLSYRSVLCIHGPHALPMDLRIGAVEVIAPQDLVAALSTGPALLSPAHVTALGSILRSNLEPRSVRPVPQSPIRPPLHWTRPLPGRSPGPLPPGPRFVSPKQPTRPFAHQRQARGLSSQGKRALLIAGLLVVLATAGNTLAAAVRRPQSIPASQVPSTPPTLSPASPMLTFECPGAGKGWSLRLLWKATDVPSESWDASTAPSDAGPWTVRYVGGGQPTAPIVSRLSPGSRLIVRAGGIVSTARSQVTVTAPDATC